MENTTHLWEVTYRDPRDRKSTGQTTFDVIEGTAHDASALLARAERELPKGVYLWLTRA